MTANRLLSPAINKEVRAIAPGWLACMASIGIATLVTGGGIRGLVIPVYFLGSIALGALSMGHEYSGGTLTLLLSQPRRREYLFLLKIGVLALLLLVLSAVARIALFSAPGPDGLPAVLGIGAEHWQVLAFVVPLLCGVFIAPPLTMLCRNPLAGAVFTVATTGLVVLVGEVSAAAKYGADPTTAPAAIALKVAILWWGMLAISALAAIFSWRLFMRLESIDDRGQTVPLPWPRSRAATIGGTQGFAERHPLWLLTKKELRLQQFSFVVSGLYVIGWFGLWFVRSGISELQTSLFFALTAICSVAISLLAGSLASAEERQLGTLEWHALLPMSLRTQWAVKAGTAMGVAVVLGLGVPIVLSLLTPSAEMRSEVQPMMTTGAGLTLIFLTVLSLYVSSLCGSGMRALMWSIPMALGVMSMVSSSVMRLQEVRFGSDPLFIGGVNYSLTWLRPDLVALGGRLTLLWMVLLVLGLAMYAGSLGLLLRFARTNHTSSERGRRRIANQIGRLGAFLAVVMALWFGVSQIFVAAMMERNRVAMQKIFGTLRVSAVDSRNRSAATYALVVFSESGRGGFSMIVDQANRPTGQGNFETHLRPGRYSVVAVEKLDAGSASDPDVLARLKTRATPLTIAAGDSKTLDLTLTPPF